MKGISKRRPHGLGDPLLGEVMKAHGLDELPLWKSRPKAALACMARWQELAKDRDGPVAAKGAGTADAAAAATTTTKEFTEEIKAHARALGADVVGCARLTPIMLNDNADLAHRNIIAMIVHEDYNVVLGGPRAIERVSLGTYVRCAEIATALAAHIRSLGYPAIAHHNGSDDIQAIPAMLAAGFGELGKHGSLIHPEWGASHRPGFVTTDLPLEYDAPVVFGVQDTCATCNLCVNNCPGDAIPMHDHVVTEGVKRWLTDVEKCYVYSRLREEYCHICVDVCPYIHKVNRDPVRKQTYKSYMKARKERGYSTPAWFVDDDTAAAE